MARKLVHIFLLSMVRIPSEGKNKHPEDTTWNEWHFRISPYFWYLGINGEITRTFKIMLGYPIWGGKHEFNEQFSMDMFMDGIPVSDFSSKVPLRTKQSICLNKSI